MTDTATTVLTLQPGQLAQHPNNLRDPGRDIAALAASIREVGILVPLIVVPADQVDGDWPAEITHITIDGNRRLLAAAQAGVDLPCVVRPDLAAARDTALTMATTVLARDGLTTTEQIGAVQTMLDLGITQTAISRATGTAKKNVAAAKKAATLTDDTAERAGGFDLTLTELAELADWQDDIHTVTALINGARHGQFEHVLARAKQERKQRLDIERATAELTAAGVTVVDVGLEWERTPFRLTALKTPDGDSPTEETHRSCPGHVARVQPNYNGGFDISYGCCLPTAQSGHLARHGDHGSAAGYTGHGPMNEVQKAERAELIRRNKETPVDCTIVSASSSCPGAVGSRSDRRWSCGCAGGTTGCRSAEHSHDRRGAAFRRWTVGGPGGRRSASDRVVEFPRGAGRGGLFSGDVPLLCA